MNARARLVAAEIELATAMKERDVRKAVDADLARQREAVKDDDPAAGAIAIARRQVRHGMGHWDPVTMPIMHGLVRKPGLAQIERQIARLTQEVEELRAHVTRWPTPTTTHPYRYIGRPHITNFDGRDLEAGDVVQLGENWAADTSRFAPVDEAPIGKESA
jgi:hypothetical protein